MAQPNRGKRRVKRKRRAEDQAPPSWLTPVVTLFLVAGLCVSIYLARLYLLVHSPGAGEVDSFCNINAAFNCVSVATSEYSTFLGLPVALWGMEFFSLCIGLVLFSAWGIWRIKRWDSLVFLLMGLGLVACGVLAWISAYKIHSFCIMCMAVYGVVVIVFILLLAAARWPVGELFTAGPRQALAWASSGRGALAVLLVGGIGISQFYWVPRLINVEQKPDIGISVKGIETSGTSIGKPGAPIRIEEFTDYQCPFCSKAHQVMMRLLKKFPDKIHLTHRDYPLDEACNPNIKRAFHPAACAAAIHSRCAARQGKFWPYDRLLFHNGKSLDKELMEQLAEKVGLDMEKLRACAKSPVVRQVIIDDLMEGNSRGVEGTPAFFVNGEKIVGARSFKFWVEKITSLLQKQ